MSQMILGGDGGGDTDIDLATPATKQALERLLQQLVRSLPENVRSSCWQKLSVQQQNCEREILMYHNC